VVINVPSSSSLSSSIISIIIQKTIHCNISILSNSLKAHNPQMHLARQKHSIGGGDDLGSVTIHLHSNSVENPQELSRALEQLYGRDSFNVEMRNDIYVIQIYRETLRGSIIGPTCKNSQIYA
jgi:hypothetical protein